jgi:hypothetical protein
MDWESTFCISYKKYTNVFIVYFNNNNANMIYKLKMPLKLVKHNDSNELKEMMPAGMQFVLGIAIPSSTRAPEFPHIGRSA